MIMIEGKKMIMIVTKYGREISKQNGVCIWGFRDHRAWLARCVSCLDFDACACPSRSRIHIRKQRGWRKQTSLAFMRRTAPGYSVTQHPQHTYIHGHTHAHTHIQVACEIHAHEHTAIVTK